MFKTFKFKERFSAQFRGEFFNVFNIPKLLQGKWCAIIVGSHHRRPEHNARRRINESDSRDWRSSRNRGGPEVDLLSFFRSLVA